MKSCEWLPFLLCGPVEVAAELLAVGPAETEEFTRGDFFGVEAGISFDSPAQIGASPRCEAITPGQTPGECELLDQKLSLAPN